MFGVMHREFHVFPPPNPPRQKSEQRENQTDILWFACAVFQMTARRSTSIQGSNGFHVNNFFIDRLNSRSSSKSTRNKTHGPDPLKQHVEHSFP